MQTREEQIQAFFIALGDSSQRKRKLAEMLGDKASYSMPPMPPIEGKEDVLNWWNCTRPNEIFPDLSFTVERIDCVGDRAYVERTEHFHTADGAVDYSAPMISVLQFEDDQVVRWEDIIPPPLKVVEAASPPPDGDRAGKRYYKHSMFAPPLEEESRKKISVRSLAEIKKAREDYLKSAWLDRHFESRELVKQGRLRLVADDVSDNDHELPVAKWQETVRIGNRLREELPPEVIGQPTIFEWGIVCGKLSALRWVLGEDWDNLTT